ncbi:sensor histidine kinase [Mucilaginibacter agri]|uniref:histidine kinase n=1 Tax=Mucilaginibacter agri TaxID=2695265 RepID=A0A965ZH78_9SPHI|nr:HAMP domain-containing sensor histidine kinase [Mucilaginibacter agri]NCD71028.1 sensor histidine kinase [Mucilaginibacter agri]
MRLLTKYNRINLITTVIVMFITGIIYYQTIKIILTDKIDKNLVVEENEVFEHVRLNNNLPQVYQSDDQHITFKLVTSPVTRRFIDTAFLNPPDKDPESGRGLITSVKVKGDTYQVSVVESKVETEDLIRIIFMITIAVILLLVMSLFVINRLTINRLWKPFYSILSNLRSFNITDKKGAVSVPSNTDEFNELNNAIVVMESKAKNDYQDLKAFTENASHELLTPIAVINSKLDTLIQTGLFSEQQSNLLGDLYESVSRLTRLNRAMLLMVKIENHLINDDQYVNVKDVVEQLLAQFHELYADKDITVTKQLSDKQIYTSRSLLEILLNNLLSNAIRHNLAGGKIDITLDYHKLSIKNTGKGQALNSNDIFKRFNKSSHSEGTGLGLTISKQICDSYGFELSYKYDDPYHVMSIYFKD